ncbi:type II toxin-antitoxin system PemK/MazF family toxin [Subsaximicrobium wynnwilliamsii]|jgi:mRNA interferase MazF|uniref:mRNA interferase n=1 Tax=Subsaximicrobium wynnwilliamsii TaxID=291179 RepID=A0A5C6ZNZ0_9FLAO|nr:type II toxin-antitoxin system PemK/MazF family toxin [Subsaximicrobium wynnwilliamsii]TXD85383.1 type II toxin-antitoxin system PemK/MazF family toxin [Subsaximicrobium wynnwilliamsii]TXD90736.1 type II toxin-antitoxin system PemK/MazF family toxin [Subsaximicrobium wynnwilliamsii]TXE05243.1 type II toxin-antitoxin system PemK/MazF family toxin [Subsaximicrobium wynnwilliamsii]
MRQREIWNVYFDPVQGSEQAGNRPAVIVSGNNLNKNLDVVWVCPLSSSIHKFEGNPILEPDAENGLKLKSEIMIFHLRSISKERFKKKIGSISSKEMDAVFVTINDLMVF